MARKFVGILFSHPKDFTPVCTTELAQAARLMPEWEKRNVKIIGLSVDTGENHAGWEKDIEETSRPSFKFSGACRSRPGGHQALWNGSSGM